jgi:hypothetical protein
MAVGSAGEAANGKGVRGSKAAQMHVTALQRRTHVKYDLNNILDSRHPAPGDAEGIFFIYIFGMSFTAVARRIFFVGSLPLWH